MVALLATPSQWARLNGEQQTLIGGRGADTLTVGEWSELLEGLVAFERTRGEAARTLVPLLAAGIVVVAVMALLPAMAGAAVPAALGPVGVFGGGAVVLSLGAMSLWLRSRRVPVEIGGFTLPFIRTLERDLGGSAQLWLAVRCRASSDDDARWLEGAVELDERRLLHFSARDVIEDQGLVCWLRATVSSVSEIEAHRAGEDDPSASGMTRAAASKAVEGGNPFTSMEMLALKTAHGIQKDLARLEAFGDLAVPPPAVGDVTGEATGKQAGGRSEAKVTALETLWQRAAAGEGAHS